MDGAGQENSDSDSGDSWTLLDGPTNDALTASNNPIMDAIDNHNKDEDTDGISIISDSESETPTFSNLSSSNLAFEEDHATNALSPLDVPSIIDPPTSQNIQNQQKPETLNVDDDFLVDNNIKHKTYVHRRNKKMSTVLNIIMLGSVITAAGVAFGHLWGGRNECSSNTIPSVNKILSNLYKLQEENAFLRNKIKELTSFHSFKNSQKPPSKQNKYKKVFEEPLQTDNSKHVIKVDDKTNNLNANNFDDFAYEKEFVDEIGKLKAVYIQNKSLLDNEIHTRAKREGDLMKNTNNSKLNNKMNQRNKRENDLSQNSKLNTENQNKFQNVASNMEINNINFVNDEKSSNEIDQNDVNNMYNKKITYADSLKSNVHKKFTIPENNKLNENKAKHSNKKPKEENETIFDKSVSEEDLKKDNRYIGQKYKRDRSQKHDRQKPYKKQKRRNKYEEWEMKGGLMRDYDESSLLPSKGDAYETNTFTKEIYPEIKDDNAYVATKANSIDNKQAEIPKKQVKPYTGKKSNWYEERAIVRNEARKRLEQALFGETSPNRAGWYFRRMQKREQCRAKIDNTTYRKIPKQNMNFKIKH